MSPAVAKRKPADTIAAIPEVAAAIQRQQDADIAATNKYLEAYRTAVALAARGEPIPATVADSAVVAANTLRFKPTRFEVDVAAMRQAAALDKQEASLRARTVAAKEESVAIRDQLRELEALRRELLAKQHRLIATGFEVAGISQERQRLVTDAPHLFRNAEQLSDAQWNHARA